MKGYKAFESDLTCRGFQYEIGKTYHMDGEIALCERGFHFCGNPHRCLAYYDWQSRLCEVEASGDILGSADDKLVTNTLTIIRELKGVEKNRIIYAYRYGCGNGYGYGYAYRYGCGYGYGYGNGNRDGYGDGYGCGNGNRDGCGYGCGFGTINKVLIFKEED